MIIGISKICPACNQSFICRQEDIANCDCQSLKLSVSEQAVIAAVYSDCLCIKCISSMLESAERGPIVEPNNIVKYL